MRVRNLLILLLVILIIAACTLVVFNGVSFGIKRFYPLEAVKLGLDLTGGVSIVYQAADPTIEDLETKLEGAMSIFRSRLDSKGFTEATISRQGDDRIRVEIPIQQDSSMTDPNEIVAYIGTPAKLEFQSPDGETILQGEDIVSAKPAYVDGDYVVAFELSSNGATVFAEATQTYLKQKISIVLDGQTISAPTVNQVIPNGEGVIEGGFTQESATNLAMQIESGALPLELTTIEQRSLNSTLGDEALANSIKAAIIGLIVLMIFMIVMYRLPGLMADIALIFYITLVMFFIAWFEVQLTLPGIAGIILGIGMAVDANVVIFARFKEEYYAGKSIRSALKSGFNKAARAIVDSNVTTIIAAIVLAVFGTGSIKGFAYTLAISIVVSVFTALLVTQGLMKLVTVIFPNGKKMFLPTKKIKEGGKEQ